MPLKIAETSHDGRAHATGHTWCLVDRSTDKMISVHKRGEAARMAKAILQEAANCRAAIGVPATALHEITTRLYEQMYPGRGGSYDWLTGIQAKRLADAVQRELRRR
jgi:hypothetical protein